MERRRLKTVMIFILALANALLLYDLGRFRLEEAAARRRAGERLADLFAADGIVLPPDAISADPPPDALLLSWDAALKDTAVRFFLGDSLEMFLADGVWTGRAGGAAAEFREDGHFTVSGLAAEDGAELCRRFCREWSLLCPDLPERPDGVFTAGAVFNGLPVVNCGVTFTFADGVLREASGTLLPRSGTPADMTLLSAFGALTAFQTMRRESRTVVSRVTGVSPCYALADSGGLSPRLVPVWNIATDTRTYRVDCATGAVSAA